MWEPDFAEFSNALFEVLYWLNYLMRLNCQNDMQVCLTQNKFALMRCKIDDMNVTALSSENYQSYCLYLYYLFEACVHSHRSYECVAVCLLIVFVLVFSVLNMFNIAALQRCLLIIASVSFRFWLVFMF